MGVLDTRLSENIPLLHVCRFGACCVDRLVGADLIDGNDSHPSTVLPVQAYVAPASHAVGIRSYRFDAARPFACDGSACAPVLHDCF